MAYSFDAPPSALRRPYLIDSPAAPMATSAADLPEGEFGRGVASSFGGSLAAIESYGAELARGLGFRDFADKTAASALRRSADASAVAPFTQWDDVDGAGSFGRFAAGAVGGAMGSSVIPALAGAVGGTPAMMASMVPLGGGEVTLEHQRNPNANPALGSATPFLTANLRGMGSAAMNSIPLMAAVGRGPLAAATKGFLPRVAGSVATSAAGEAGDEITGQMAGSYLRGEPMDNIDWKRVKEAGIYGAIGESPFALSHGAVGGIGDVAGPAAKALAESKAGGLAKDAYGAVKGAAGAVADVAGPHLREAGQAAKDIAGDLGSEAKAIYKDDGTQAAKAVAMGKSTGEIIKDRLAAWENPNHREFKQSLDLLADGMASPKEEYNTPSARQTMISDGLGRLGELRDSLTPEEAAQLDQYVDATDPNELLARSGEVGTFLRDTVKRVGLRDASKIFDAGPLKGTKFSKAGAKPPPELQADIGRFSSLVDAMTFFGRADDLNRMGQSEAVAKANEATPRQAKMRRGDKTIPSGLTEEQATVAVGDLASTLARHFSDASDGDTGNFIGGFVRYLGKVAKADPEAMDRLPKVYDAIKENADHFTDPGKGRHNFEVALNEARSLGNLWQKGDTEKYVDRLKGFVQRIKIAEEPETKALEKLSKKSESPLSSDQVREFMSTYRSLRAKADRDPSIAQPTVDLAELERAASLKRHFPEKNVEEVRRILSRGLLESPSVDNRIETVEGIERSRGEEFTDRDIPANTLSEAAGAELMEPTKPQILTDVGALSRHATASSYNRGTGKRRSEMEHALAGLEGSDVMPGPSHRFSHMDALEAARHLARTDAELRTPGQILTEHLDKSMKRSKAEAVKAREELGPDVPADALVAEAQAAHKVDPDYDARAFFERQVGPGRKADLLEALFWHGVHTEHYAVHGAEEHAFKFPYSFATIEGKGEINAKYRDKWLGDMANREPSLEGKEGDHFDPTAPHGRVDADHAKGELAFNGPKKKGKATSFTLDMNKAIDRSLQDRKAESTPASRLEALVDLVMHLSDDSTLTDTKNPIPDSTLAALGFETAETLDPTKKVSMDPALAKALGVLAPKQEFGAADIVVRTGPGDRTKGFLTGFKDEDGRNISVDVRKAVLSAAEARGVEPDGLPRLDHQTIAALLDDVKAAIKERTGKAVSDKDLADVTLHENFKGEQTKGSMLAKLRSAEAETTPMIARGADQLTVRRIQEKIAEAEQQLGGADAATVRAYRKLKALDPSSETFKQKTAELARQIKSLQLTPENRAQIERLITEANEDFDAGQVKDAAAAEYAAPEGQLPRVRKGEEPGSFIQDDPYSGQGPFTEQAAQKNAEFDALRPTPGVVTSNERALARYENLNRILEKKAGRVERTVEGVTDVSEIGRSETLKGQMGEPTDADQGKDQLRTSPRPEPLTGEQPAPKGEYAGQVRSMIKDGESVSDIVSAVSGYPRAGLQSIFDDLASETKPALKNLRKQVGAMIETAPEVAAPAAPKAKPLAKPEPGTKFSKAGEGTEGEDTQTEYDKALAASAKKFGEHAPEHALVDRIEGGVGSYDKPVSPKDKGRIAISRMAKSVGQAGSHEDLHHFFQLLRGLGGEGAKVIDTLIRGTDNPALHEQALELLSKDLNEADAAALREHFHSDKEERSSYLYQLRAAGLIKFSPAAEGAFKKMFNWIKKQIGFISDADKAENLFQALDEGRLALDFDNPTAISRAMGQEKRLALAYRAFDAKIRPLAKAIGDAFTPSHKLMMDSNVPAMKALADKYGRLNPDAEGYQGVYYERQKLATKLGNEVGKLLEPHDATTRDAALAEVMTGKPKSELAKQLDGFLRKYTPKDKYLPFIPDREAIDKNYDEFIADAVPTGTKPRGQVQRALSAVTANEVFKTDEQLPTFEFKSDAKRAKWSQKNTEAYLGEFVHRYASKESRAKAFGEDGSGLLQLMEEIKKDGSAADVDLATKYVGGAEGWLGADMNPQLRALQAAAITGLNVITLPLSAFSAMVDPVYIGARSGSLAETFNAFGAALKSMVDTVTQKEGRLTGDAAKFAEDINLMEQHAVAAPMADMFSSYQLEGLSRKVNSAFFRWNFMQGVERAMFAASAQAAQSFLVEHARGTGKFSGHYLKELGLSKDDVKLKDDGTLKVFENDGLTTDEARKIQSAIHAFSYRSAARPTPLSNAPWMNDKRFAMIAHMKPFVMAQSHGILSWLEEQAAAKNYYPLALSASAIPVQMALNVARNAFTHASVPPNWLGSFASAAGNAGLMGRWDFAYDVFNNAATGMGMGTGVEALGGPGVEMVLGELKKLRGKK